MIYDLKKRLKINDLSLELKAKITNLKSKIPGLAFGLPRAGLNLKSNNGVAALLTIVIISAAVLIMVTSASWLGLGELELGYTSQQGSEALALADGCLDETLRRIRLDTSYGVGTGTINLTLSNGSCTIDVTASGSDRSIVILGTVNNYNKKIAANITLAGSQITINSWNEVSD